MNPLALHSLSERAGASRWLISAAVIVSVHAAAVAAALAYYTQTPPPGQVVPAIMVEMAPATAAPQASPLDLAPGPQMQEAEAAPSEPAPPPEDHAAAMAEIEPTPQQPNPPVPVPLQPKPPREEENNSPSQQPAKIESARRKPVRQPQRLAKQHAEQSPAPRSSAAPNVADRAPQASAAAAGASAAAMMPTYRQRLAAHLQRFKRYPAAARAAGEQGTATLSFTVGRAGEVLSARLSRSSGHAELDAETLALLRRAQPLPPFPPELPQASLSFAVPVQFSVR